MNPYDHMSSSAIVTYSGKVIEPLNPDPEQIDILDIAHALSNQCRFTGHTSEFYSVAQHSVLVSQHCATPDALWGLLHDASEAYLADMARPIKRTEWGKEYVVAEARLMIAVAYKFGLEDNASLIPLRVMPDSVKYTDDVLLRTEMLDLMPEGVAGTLPPGETLPVRIKCWPPEVAKHHFMERYRELT